MGSEIYTRAASPMVHSLAFFSLIITYEPLNSRFFFSSGVLVLKQIGPFSYIPLILLILIPLHALLIVDFDSLSVTISFMSCQDSRGVH